LWRLAGRIGKKKAAMAVAHSILVIAYHVMADPPLPTATSDRVGSSIEAIPSCARTQGTRTVHSRVRCDAMATTGWSVALEVDGR
jgi:hypothetical protein